MRILSICALLICTISRARSLTLTEAGQFFNSRRHGGHVGVTENEISYIILSNGMPDHAPDALTPNTIIPRNHLFSVPKNPTVAEEPGCLPMGPIGISRTGVVIFNPLNKEGQNAVEGDTSEQLDHCNGHPDPLGTYHYHALPKGCVYAGSTDELIGVARDGFPIYGPMASDLGREVVNADLDKCHGRFVNGQYRYYATNEFPYILGCFRGTLPRRFDEVSTVCNETSAFDDKWGYLCRCENPGAMVRPGQGRLPPGVGSDGTQRPVGFIPGQRPFGRRPMFGQFPGMAIGPNGQPIRMGNQLQIGPNGQIIGTGNQLQVGPNGQLINNRNQIRVGPNGQMFINSRNQPRVGPNENPIQLPVSRGPGGLPGQVQRPIGFLPPQTQAEGEQIEVDVNGLPITGGNPTQMAIMGGVPSSPGPVEGIERPNGNPVQGQLPIRLGFLPTGQPIQIRGEQPNGVPRQQTIPRPLGFIPLQQPAEGERLNRFNGRPQFPGFLPSVNVDGEQPVPVNRPTQSGELPNGIPGQQDIPRPIGFIPSQRQAEGVEQPNRFNGQRQFPGVSPIVNVDRERPVPVNNAPQTSEPRAVHGVPQNGGQPRFINSAPEEGEPPKPVFMNGVPPMTRFVRTQNGQVVQVLVNPGIQTGQTLNVPRLTRPLGSNQMFQGRNFGPIPITFLSRNGGIVPSSNPKFLEQPPVVGPPLVGPTVSGVDAGQQSEGLLRPRPPKPNVAPPLARSIANNVVQGQGQMQRFVPMQPFSNQRAQRAQARNVQNNPSQLETIEGLEILDRSMQNNKAEMIRQQKPRGAQYGKYRLFNMYLQNNL